MGFMATPTFTKASGRWVLTMAFIGAPKAEFCCGECEKFNRKAKTFSFNWTGRQAGMVGAQCQWCGTINSFWDRGRPQIFV